MKHKVLAICLALIAMLSLVVLTLILELTMVIAPMNHSITHYVWYPSPVMVTCYWDADKNTYDNCRKAK